MVKTTTKIALASVVIASGLNAAEGGNAKSASMDNIKIKGLHYLGFTSTFDKDGKNKANRFESRRNYFTLKAGLGNKNYFKLTLDTFQNSVDKDSKDKDNGSWLVRAKAAYLYLNNVLPATGVEFGLVHKTWLGYETHGGWNFNSINNAFMAEKSGVGQNGSVGFGFDLKTKTPYFSSELGVYNGEGYKFAVKDNANLSTELRATAHILGTGKEKRKEKLTYLDLSLHGEFSRLDMKKGNKDWNDMGVHLVYNMPAFLIAAQYMKSQNDGGCYEGNGYSINSELRPFGNKNYILARYDAWNQTGDKQAGKHDNAINTIVGLVHKYDKHTRFILSAKDSKFADNSSKNNRNVMFTAEVKY